MNTPRLTRSLGILLLALLAALPATADRIELSDGSILHGKLLSADGGKFRLETKFAGVVEIAQEHIVNFATDEAVHVGLKAGSQVLGTVSPTAGGITVVAADGQMSAAAANVVAVWRPGEDSPTLREAKSAAEKARRRWAYEASASINGRTGGNEKFAGSVGVKATLESSQDKLVFSGTINRAQENGNTTANDWKAGVDYSSFFSDAGVWYARTELAKDRIKAIDLRSNSAFGLGRKLVKSDRQDLEVRFGLGYTYEAYTTGGPDFESAGLDLALINAMTLGWSRMNNKLTWTPSFEDFANYRLVHETSFDLPIKGADFWKLRMGVSNDYQSMPAAGVERLDTTYFTALILSWK
jgi:putative salt-induced outer membrane protein YdiY